MKRYLSFILVFVLMLTILPMSVYATECEDSEQETVIAQACAVFPEYAALIRGKFPHSQCPIIPMSRLSLFSKRLVHFQRMKESHIHNFLMAMESSYWKLTMQPHQQ